MGNARVSLTVSHGTWEENCLGNVILQSARLRSFNIVPLDLNCFTATRKNNLIFIVLSQKSASQHHKTHSPKYSIFGNWKIFNLVNICLLFGEMWCAEKYQYYCFMVYWKLHCSMLIIGFRMPQIDIRMEVEIKRGTAEEGTSQQSHSIGTALANVAKWFI